MTIVRVPEGGGVGVGGQKANRQGEDGKLCMDVLYLKKKIEKKRYGSRKQTKYVTVA